MDSGDAVERQEWMGLLARASEAELARLWQQAGTKPVYRFLRQPERGLAMVRGRTGGDGPPFNLGEIVVARCSVGLADGRIGHAYVAGRSLEKAEMAAVLDAMLQSPDDRERLLKLVIAPLRSEEEAKKRLKAGRSAATRVDFFTIARGEDE